ncbi:MAG TPA: hypothetical protein VKH35_07960 [Thermoanaerobaculia bacterium]|nr:hypothetical protein [Thermoanaerobaculia bacterium]
MDQASLQKPLNGDPAVDVDILNASRSEARGDIGRSPRHLFHDCSGRSSSDRTTTEHENGLLAVSPPAEAEDCFEGLPADDECIHGAHELLVAVRFVTGRREKIE